jgi:hypothetical protein
MGCDIHPYAERKEGNQWVPVTINIFDCRNYGLFGFLAGVRNYSEVPPISAPRGLPPDVSFDTRDAYERWDLDAHSASWLSVTELVAFDYNQTMEDRRVTIQTGPHSWNGGATAEPGGGKIMTFREFLGEAFFADLEQLKMAKAERVIFWFDS